MVNYRPFFQIEEKPCHKFNLNNLYIPVGRVVMLKRLTNIIHQKIHCHKLPVTVHMGVIHTGTKLKLKNVVLAITRGRSSMFILHLLQYSSTNYNITLLLITI